MTCGPTWVRVDPVRVISNISSGELGHAVVHGLRKEKAKVTLLQGPVTHPLSTTGARVVAFRYFDELSRLLKHELKKRSYAIVIHAAAVADYALKNSFRGKISSRTKNLRLCLTPTPKLIAQIKKIDPNIFLVGFKLETDLTEKRLIQKARGLIREAKCDLVVANTLCAKAYRACIIDAQGRVLAKARTRAKTAACLIKVLKGRL